MKIILIIFLAVLIVGTEQTNYCTVECDGEPHIACKHSETFDASCPSIKRIIKLGPAEQRLLKKLHNEKRNKIAGGKLKGYNPACRMATMQWDDELAYLAQLNTYQCKMQHDRCHNTDTFLSSGQNLGLTLYLGRPLNVTEFINRAVNGWFNEYKYCNQAFIDEFPNMYSGPKIGHFTELVIDRNTHLGCAAALYGEGEKGWNTFLLVCNYASVNAVEFPIYKSCRKPAQECKKRNPNYKYLCSTSEKYDVNVWMKNGFVYT